MAKKMSRLNRSQLAHDRLWIKYSKGTSKTSRIKADYHESVYMRQYRIKRVLSSEEKRKIFESVKH